MAVADFCASVQCSTSYFTGAELSLPRARRRSTSLPFPVLAGQRRVPLIGQASLGTESFTDRISSQRWSGAVSGKRRLDVKRRAKFQQFQRPTPSEEPAGALEELPGWEESDDESSEEDEERADGVLPESLEGAILQSSESAALFVQSGGDRAITFNVKREAAGRAVLEEGLPHGKLFSRYSKIGVTTNPMLRKFAAKVELLLPQMANSGEEGDQLKLWNLSRVFLEDLQLRLRTQQLKAIFPDAGVAAMLKYQWKDASFTFASLNDRKPVTIDDEVVVLVQPDFQMLSNVEKIASSLLGAVDGPPRPLIMFNPALQSGEVGIGLNVRRMREFFLSTFNPVYSMRTLSFGAIFRRYPGSWKVFFDDEKVPGRFLLANEDPTRPLLEDVEMMFLTRGKRGEDGADKEAGPLQNLVGVFSSMSRFMQSLSR